MSNCPRCNYPDTRDGHRYKGIYTYGKPCPHCLFTEAKGQGTFTEMRPASAMAELFGRLKGIAKRRRIRVDKVHEEALQDFIEKDFVRPKGGYSDRALDTPRGAQTDQAVLKRPLTIPDIEECPKEKLGEWLHACTMDRRKILALKNDVEAALRLYSQAEGRLVERMTEVQLEERGW